MELYSYFRSSAAFRVRIALALKGLDYTYKAISLVGAVGDHKKPDYLALNPQGRVPYLVDGDVSISQSPAMLEYLEESYGEPALLPKSIKQRAEVRALCSLIGCDIHPLNNLSVLVYLRGELGGTDETVSVWYSHWITEGFTALEKKITEQGPNQRTVYGDTVTLADVYLAPQVWNALRFNVDMSAFPAIMAIYEHLLTLEAFQKALPENQPDAPA